MGTIKQLPNGKFQISVYDHSGKRIRMRFEKHKYAKAFIDRIENEKSSQKLISVGLKRQSSTVENSIDEFGQTKAGLRKRSIDKYNYVLEQFRIFCANEKIINMEDFTRDNADKFWSAITSSGVTSKTANFYLMTVKALFDYEIIRDRLFRNPFSHIKAQKEKSKSLIERQEDYYDAAEIKSFFSVTMQEKDRHVFLTLFLTGLRISELQSLTWERSIDFEKKLIRVRNYEDYEAKTETSERDIPMTDLLYETLLKMSENKKEGYVFTSEKGNMISERTLLSKCKSIAVEAGISKTATLHKWRHSFSSHVLNTGIQYEERQYLLGHKPESMTDRYTKIDPTRLQHKLTKLDALFNNKTKLEK